jgi:hypothetical protein
MDVISRDNITKADKIFISLLDIVIGHQFHQSSHLKIVHPLISIL